MFWDCFGKAKKLYDWVNWMIEWKGNFVSRSAMDHNFPSKFVLIAAEYPTLALFNFVVPLRSHCRPRYALNPVVLLLEQEWVFFENFKAVFGIEKGDWDAA